MHVFKVTKYAAYLAAVEAFAADTGVTELTIREPEVGGFVNFGLEPNIEGHGLIGLFPSDLTGYHDGARVPLATGVALVRAMLRDNGTWCRLEVDGRFFVYIGYDQYMHIGSAEPCDDAVARLRALGLFPVPVHSSPWDPHREKLEVPRPADDEFWTELASLAAERGTVILEEQYVGNASRWHRLRSSDTAAIRAGLTPRARLTVWPELNEDVGAELRTLDDRLTVTVVWEDRDGRISDFWAHGEDRPAIAVRLTKAKSALVISCLEDELT